MLNEKPKNEIAYNLDKYELKIYDAIQSMGISICSRIEVKEVLKSCIQLSGCQTPAVEDFEFILDFVIANFGIFKLKELRTAFEMLAADKLSVEKHIIFNPKLVGEVMSAYKKIAVQVRSKIEPKEETIVKEIDEEQAIQDEVLYWKTSKKNWLFLNILVFDYLWKRKQIVLTPEQVAYIKDQVITHLKRKNNEEYKDEVIIRNNCKKYTLAMYLNNQL